MTSQTATTPTCRDLVEAAWQTCRDEIATMLNPHGHFTFGDDGSLDVIVHIGEDTHRYAADSTEFWRDDDGELNADLFWDEEGDRIEEEQRERFDDYGLSFDWVEPDTFDDQPRGYFRYQLCWGGPSQEIRFYCDRNQPTPDRIEFWHLDWFDGASVDITRDAVAQQVWGELADYADVMREEG